VINFKASLAGGCTKELVASVLTPELLKPPVERRLFLKAGHHLQDLVTSFLCNAGVNIPTARLSNELEGSAEYKDYRVTGHIDGLRVEDHEPIILEIKAITDKWFNKVLQADSWQDVYPQYYDQVQVYLSFDSYRGEGYTVVGPFRKANMVFYNRDTSEILQGISPDIANTLFREDCIVEPSPHSLSLIRHRWTTASAYIHHNYSPTECDKPGYCFFCKEFTPSDTYTPGVVLEKDPYFEVWAETYKEARALMLRERNKIIKRFDKYTTDKLIIAGKKYYRSRFS
jgi:hypothetical protein